MRIDAIGHASYLIETSAATILTDPVFSDPFEAGANESYPRRVVDAAGLPTVDCIALSHRHFDHFDLRTLAGLDRGVTVFYPGDDELIAHALATLGFTRTRPLKPWHKARLGSLEILATPSLVDWPEIGFVIRDESAAIWSLVDTVVDARIIETVLDSVGKLDCLFAPYSPILQSELRDPSRAKGLDSDAYAWLLEIVTRTSPRTVVPSAGGLRYAAAPWQDAYGFPVRPQRFLGDVADAAPDVVPLLLNPGDSLELVCDTHRLLPGGAKYVTVAAEDLSFSAWEHDPSCGIPDFRDGGAHSPGVGEVLASVERYVTAQLIADIEHPANADRLAAWREWQVRWRLDLYAPDEAHCESRSEPRRTWWIDFASEKLALRDGALLDASIRTAVTATGLHDLLRGEASLYSFMFTDQIRTTRRVYTVSPKGLRHPDHEVPDPLLHALTGPRDLDAAYVNAQLAHLTSDGRST